MNKDVAFIIEKIDNMLNIINSVRNEPTPDWVNQHDYASGYFVGRKSSSNINAVNLSTIKDMLEKLNDKVSS
jgi:hypothetical protein